MIIILDYLSIDFWKQFDSNMNEHYMCRYLNFINSRVRCLDDYCENHHIIPRCFNSPYNNTIKLSAREHYIAHMILAKCFTNNFKYKMEHAFTMMVFQKNMYKRDYKVTSRVYEKCKISNSKRMCQVMNTPDMKKAVSTRQKKYIQDRFNGGTFYDSTGIEAVNKNKISITNGKVNKYILKDEMIPDGWVIGNTQKKKDDSWRKHLKESWAKNRANRVGKNHPMHGKGYLVSGSNGSTYGCKGITNGRENKFVKIADLDKYIKDGWRVGICRFKK